MHGSWVLAHHSWGKSLPAGQRTGELVGSAVHQHQSFPAAGGWLHQQMVHRGMVQGRGAGTWCRDVVLVRGAGTWCREHVPRSRSTGRITSQPSHGQAYGPGCSAKCTVAYATITYGSLSIAHQFRMHLQLTHELRHGVNCSLVSVLYQYFRPNKTCRMVMSSARPLVSMWELKLFL